MTDIPNIDLKAAVEAVRLVTRICEIVDIDPDTHEETYWELRGALDPVLDEIERLRKIIKRLDGLAYQACGHIANKGIAADYRKNLWLCQRVDLAEQPPDQQPKQPEDPA